MVSGIDRTLAELSHIDPTTEEIGKLVSESAILLREAAGRLRKYAEQVEADPERLVWVEDRLALIHRVSKKYGGTIGAALEVQARVRQELDGLTHADARLDACRSRIETRRIAMVELARRLTTQRIAAAQRMTNSVRHQLDGLKMVHTRFSVELRSEGEGGYGPNGADQPVFLLSANDGEPLMPMARVASGGELSRVMLALKSVLADADGVPVLIFDEIDTGVGGAVAAAIGKRLRALGRLHQVFCVTHLPQVASQAVHHFSFAKSRTKDRTVTTVRRLKGIDRELEVARMLGGEVITPKVKATAAELLAAAKD